MIQLPEQFGRYRLLTRLAVGGMGEIFLGRHRNAEGVDRLVVVKRILPHLTRDTDFVSYFVHEGRIASLLSHPNVVQTYELGRLGEQYYIAMEYISGPTLVRLLASALQRHRQLSIPLILHLATRLARALEYVHARKDLEGRPLQIIHMDLAPHNVLVDPDAEPRLLDFGIARAAGMSQAHVRRDFRGRSAYLAPEQLDGLPVDQRVDLFALGIIMHEMALGRPLFRARSESQTVTRILHAPIPVPRQARADCPEALSRIILKALRRDRDERYQEAAEILRDLDACGSTHGLLAPVTQLRAELAHLMHTGTLARIYEQPTPSAADPSEFERQGTTIV